jgi:DNA-binding beta-propeller fold protein YncE
VADDGYSRIEKFNSAGQGSFFASSLNAPLGLAFDSSGNLYAALDGSSEIEKFNSAGQGSVFASGLNAPYGLAFDSSGNLYAGLDGSSEIEEFNSAGQGSVYASGLNSPTFIAVQEIPEPSTWAILALGATAFLGSRRLQHLLVSSST